jgi:hypothetical protein
MKYSNIITSAAFLILAMMSPISAFAFPIFAPPSAYANCKSSPSFFGDSSNIAAGFAGGTLTNLTWDGVNNKLALTAGQSSGTFTSRVIDNSCAGVGFPWLTFQWTTTLPFGKELPASNETTTSYPGKTNSTLLNNIVGIWHFNEAAGYNGTANEVVDSSGQNRHGVIMSSWGTVTNTKVSGLFNNSWNCSDGLPMKINAASMPAGSTTALSFSMWFKAGGASTGYDQFAMGDNGTYWWRLQWTNLNHIDVSTQTSGGGGYIGETALVTTGVWHHLALVLNNGTGNLWYDGTKITNTYPAGTGFPQLDTYICNNAKVTYDEAAMWYRALADAEVLELYRRGANRLRIQVRNCTSSTCADNPAWQGPNGTATTYFTELNNNSNQSTQLGTVQAGTPSILLSNFGSVTKSNRYIQYKILFDTDNTTYSPDIKTAGPGR